MGGHPPPLARGAATYPRTGNAGITSSARSQCKRHGAALPAPQKIYGCMRNEELTNTIVFLLVCTAPRMRGETITVTLCFLVFFRETTLTGTVAKLSDDPSKPHTANTSNLLQQLLFVYLIY